MKNNKLIIAVCVLCLLINSICVCGQETKSSEQVPTIFIVGDSTASNGPDKGWGSHLGKYFDTAKIKIINRAIGGRSSRTYQSEGTWEMILPQLKPGDYVLLQFGHNDIGPINTEFVSRASLPGLGEETEEIDIDNRFVKKHEVVHTYGWYMRKYITDTKAKGATPIVLSVTVRNIWENGKVERGLGEYRKWAEDVAREMKITFVDAATIIADEYEKLGQEKVKEYFPQDHTHTTPEAADLNARLIASGLRNILGDYLSEQGKHLPQNQSNTQQESKEVDTAGWAAREQPKPDPNLPTLFIIGDSTVKANQGNGEMKQWGWGAPIAFYFDRTKINVENHALGGMSSRTFQTNGMWDRVLAAIKPGDFVIMQFGHNDEGALNDNRRARGTVKGSGDETEEIDNILTGKHEVVHTYGWYIKKYITDAKAKGASSIVCSMIPRNNWKNGKLDRVSETYGKWSAEAAEAEGALFIDLNSLIADHYEKEGQTKVTATYFEKGEGTHTNAAGAELNARCVIEGLKIHKDYPLSKYLSSRADTIN
ncbi:MAG: rhamnogalacturonan acetylesterase [Sedimentisphaerales bacterium]|nr:rhamnogalacturonan acetylesterase [Sedimentisphaerales bacterium]